MKIPGIIILIVAMILCFFVSGLFFANSGIIDEDGNLNELKVVQISKALDRIPLVSFDSEELQFLEIRQKCESKNGKWIEGVNECESISEIDCENIDGEYFECESACRNNPNADICILMCVQVCKFDL